MRIALNIVNYIPPLQKIGQNALHEVECVSKPMRKKCIFYFIFLKINVLLLYFDNFLHNPLRPQNRPRRIPMPKLIRPHGDLSWHPLWQSELPHTKLAEIID